MKPIPPSELRAAAVTPLSDGVVSKIAEAMAELIERQSAQAAIAALTEALHATPSTAENPNQDPYQRGRFDGVMAYQKNLVDLIQSRQNSRLTPGDVLDRLRPRDKPPVE